MSIIPDLLRYNIREMAELPGRENAQMAADISRAITSVLGKYQNDASAESDDDFVNPQGRKRK